ncbi:MAG TPA: DUF4157 domain-containing protein, partial [Streptomyces sp.]|nr:DUF4157 domain-containing protein [Streptomyces sp.]
MLRQAGHPWAQEQHRHGAGCGHRSEQEPQVQRRSAVHDVLRGGGRPLDDASRSDMESRLGADFSDVRIHTGSAAKASAAEMGARAYTSGSHVVIGDGGGDRHTLAHELTHVIQQRQGPVAGTDNGSGLSVSDPSDRFEREAEANAHRALAATPDTHQHAHDQGARSEAGGAFVTGAVQRAPADRTVSAVAHARLAQASAAVNYTQNVVIEHSGNQQRSLASTLYNSFLRMQVMRSNHFWDLSRLNSVPSPSDLDAAKTGHAHGGNCGENASVAFAYLRKCAPGQHIRKASKSGLDHAFVLIGHNDEPDSEWAVADPWPTKAKACLWDEHFAYTQDRTKIKVEEEMNADGADSVDVIHGLIRLNTAGERVATWSLKDFKGQTVDTLHAALMKGGIPMDPSLSKGDAVLKGLQAVAASDLSKVLTWSPEQLWLWCVSQVERSVLDKALGANDVKPDMVNDGINEARAAAGGKHWVWDHPDTTRT